MGEFMKETLIAGIEFYIHPLHKVQLRSFELWQGFEIVRDG